MYIQKSSDVRLVLASRSASRRAILTGAGLSYESRPADLDETRMLNELAARKVPMERRAIALSEAKAKKVALELDDPKAVVIGSDQILDLDGAALEAPGSRDEARERLLLLRGRRHDLVCGAAVFLGATLVESVATRVAAHVRDFSDEELDIYLQSVPEAALHTVGAYALEGLGARLIDRLEGDWFAALGLPLWPVLGILRRIADKEVE